MAYRNPFDRLINEFFRAQQTVETGIQRRGEEHRADRLTEEQRAEEQRRIEQGRQFQIEDREIAHQRGLEAEARAIQEARLKELQDYLQYTEPGSALWQRTQRAIREISNPLEGEGLEQREAALDSTFQYRAPGEVVEGAMVEAGTGLPTRKPDVLAEEDVNNLLAELRLRKRTADQEMMSNEALFNVAIDFVKDTEVDGQTRLAYANDILSNPNMPDSWKNAILDAAKITDKDARQRILDEGQMRRNDLAIQQQQIEMGGIQIDRALFELGEDRRLADVNYDTAVENLASAIQNRRITADQAYREYGYVPEDEGAAERMAGRLGLTVEELREGGERRWEQIRRSDDRAERLEELAIEQGEANVRLSDIQHKINEYTYERMRGIGMLEDMQNLSANLYAAAANGDASSIEAVRALAERDPTSDIAQATAGVDWDGLIEIAGEERLDIENARDYERDRRQLDLQKMRTDLAGNQINLQIARQGFYDTFGQRFLSGTHEEMAADVNAFVETMSPAEIRAIVGDMGNPAAEKEAITEKLIAEASYHRWVDNQGDLSKAFDMLMNNPPDEKEGGPYAAEAWRAQYISIGEELGMRTAVLEHTADSILAGAEIDYATARAELDKLKAEAEALRREPPSSGDSFFDNGLNALKAQAGALNDLLNTPHCDISGLYPENPGTTGTRYNPDHEEECIGYARELADISERIESLNIAQVTGDMEEAANALFGGGTSRTNPPPPPPIELPESGPLDPAQSGQFGANILGGLSAADADDPAVVAQAILDGAAAQGYELHPDYKDQLEVAANPGRQQPVNPVESFFDPTAARTPAAAQDRAQAAGVPADVYGNDTFLELVARNITSTEEGMGFINVTRNRLIGELLAEFEGEYTAEQLSQFLEQAAVQEGE